MWPYLELEKNGYVAKILKIAIAHLHGSTGHDLAATQNWKRSPVQFFRYDAFSSPESAILESRKYDLNTLLRRWAWCAYTPTSRTSEHELFVKKISWHIHELQGMEYRRRKSQVRTNIDFLVKWSIWGRCLRWSRPWLVPSFIRFW